MVRARWIAFAAIVMLSQSACAGPKPGDDTGTSTSSVASSHSPLDTAAATDEPASGSPAPHLGNGPEVQILWVGTSDPQTPAYKFVDKPYLDTITERSGGRIVVDYKTQLELNLGGSEVLRLVADGQADLGTTFPAYLASDVPFLEVIDLAGLNPTIDQARAVAHAGAEASNAELEQYGVRQVMTYSSPAQVVFCDVPIGGWDDLAGLKIRTFGASLRQVVEAAGAIPVDVDFAEVYSALERGVVDCAITGTAPGNTSHWYEVTSHLYTLPLGWATGAIYANTEWWESLEPDVQAFLEADFADLDAAYWDLTEEINQDGIDCNVGRPTCELGILTEGDDTMVEVVPTEADFERLREILSQRVLPDWVDRCGPDCATRYSEVIAPVTGVELP